MKAKLLCAICIGIFLSACGGGNDKKNNNNDPENEASVTLNVSGSASAKDGTLGEEQSTAGLLRDWLFGRSARASLHGIAPVAGVPVYLYQVDANGVIVGAALASTTTDSTGTFSFVGDYLFPADAPLVGEYANYIVRAEGLEYLSAYVSGDSADITPGSEATFQLISGRGTTSAKIILAAHSVEDFDKNEIVELGNQVGGETQNLDPEDYTDNDSYTAAIVAAAASNEETASMLANAEAAHQFCGTVTDSGGTGLQGIKILVRDHGEQLKRAVATTDINGDYCVAVQPGSYILGAINRTSTSFAASEWYTSTGGHAFRNEAEKITVADTDTIIPINFSLADGGRFSGTVTSAEAASKTTKNGVTVNFSAGIPLSGIKVLVRNYENYVVLATATTDENGNYTINVAPGDYMVTARNNTRVPYASRIHRVKNNGTAVWQYADRLTITAANTNTLNFGLYEGHVLKVVVTDPDTTPTPGMRIRVDKMSGNPGTAIRGRSNIDGFYRVWLKPATYNVSTKGQRKGNVDISLNGRILTFDKAMVPVTLTTLEPDNSPAGQLKLWFNDELRLTNEIDNADPSVGPYEGYWSNEVTRGDGSSVLWAPRLAGVVNYKLLVRVDGGQFLASQHYHQQNTYLAATMITIPGGSTSYDIGNINMQAGGIFKGKVWKDRGASPTLTTPAANTLVRIRLLGTTADDELLRVKTRGDGTFYVALPAGTYARVMAGSTSGTCATDLDCDVDISPQVVINAGLTTDAGDIELTDIP